MSFSAAIIARLGLDASGFRSELQNAARTADSAQSKMTNSVNRTAAAHERLLGSNHRVARQVQSFTQDLLSGASGAQLFASGMEGVERSLRLPLGALAGLTIGAVIVDQISQVRAAAAQFDDEFNRNTAGRSPSQFRSVGDIQSRLAETRKEKQELERQLSHQTVSEKVNDMANYALTGKDPYAERVEKINQLRKTEQSDLAALASKEREIVEVENLRVKASEREAELKKIQNKYAEEIGKAVSAGPDQNPAQADQLKELQKLETDAANQKFDAIEMELEHKQRILEIDQGIVRTTKDQASAEGVVVTASDKLLTSGEKRIEQLKEQVRYNQELRDQPGISTDERKKRSLEVEHAQGALVEAQTDEFQKTPKEKAAEFRAAQDRDLARRTVEARNRDEAAAGGDPRGPGLHVDGVRDNSDLGMYGSGVHSFGLGRRGSGPGAPFVPEGSSLTSESAWRAMFPKPGKSDGGWTPADSESLRKIEKNTDGMGANK